MHYILYTDGGARGNPGPAGAGAVLKLQIANPPAGRAGRKLQIIGEYSQYLGETTNNQAEYHALIMGLEKAKACGVGELECFLDSELLVKQMKREYRVKDKDLAPLFVKAYNLAMDFKKITFTHVPREQNKEADKLVNEAVDKALKISENSHKV
jgi:ribonuclease HI